jgi:hypothetical protein
MMRSTTPILLASGLLAVTLAAPMAAALPSLDDLVSCAWNPDFTGPLEATGLVKFHDGTTCSVTPLPCPHDPHRSCLPQLVDA